MSRPHVSDGYAVTHIGSDYNVDELEFIRAMERYRRKNRRKLLREPVGGQN